MKKGLKVILGIIGVFVLGVLIMAFILMNGMNTAQALELNQINLAQIDDGKYVGTYETTRWTNSVEVTVKDHKITDVIIVKDVMIALEGLSDRLFKKVMDKQSIEVDIETGATITSKAYLKAIENAIGGTK
ncbi:MAG: FMN-binding protein [Erysipelotrichaceae bacterium]